MSAQRDTADAAETVAATVSRASGFNARLAAMRALMDRDPVLAVATKFDARRALDGMTYARIEVANMDEPDRAISVRALVDTGSTDCELRSALIQQLDLRPDADAGFALFETAAGVQTSAPVYRALIRVHGREAPCLLSPSEDMQEDDDSDDEDEDEDEGEGVEDLDAKFGFEKISDEALLGHDALAALGLAVDTRRRRLFPAPRDEDLEGP